LDKPDRFRDPVEMLSPVDPNPAERAFVNHVGTSFSEPCVRELYSITGRKVAIVE
jgi:hypothetical protein